MQPKRTLLRLVTCGSVDDGKSTLIGRLLYDNQAVLTDQFEKLQKDSERIGTRGKDLDFALLVDGLLAEREQGITIDVAYRYFETATRKYILADSPGHEQYTRNMATAASQADVAVILIDARKGVLAQTRRHCLIAALMGIKHVIVTINKMDLVGFAQHTFTEIQREFLAFVEPLGFSQIDIIPLCAPTGNGITQFDNTLNWFSGPTLMTALELTQLSVTEFDQPEHAVFPVQLIQRPNSEFRGVAGTVTRGCLTAGQTLMVLPSKQTVTIERIVSMDGDKTIAQSGEAVTLTFDKELDISRGNVLVGANTPVSVASQFEAQIIWMHEASLLQGRQYLLKAGNQTVSVTVAPIKFKFDIDTKQHVPAERLELNDIGVCELSTDRPLIFSAFAEHQVLGAFILIDRITQDTVGAGMIKFALRRSSNVHWQSLSINRQLRAKQKNQRGAVLWFTGLSGAGKSTIADLLDKRLVALGHHTFLLDGDNVRHGLNKDLGFTDQDRVENIRRIAEVSKLMADAGLITLVSFISPFAAERRMARSLLPAGEFIEVFVDAPLNVVEARDQKGLYKKARLGHITNFTGIDSAYEPPEHPEVHLRTDTFSIEQCVDELVQVLTQSGILTAE